MNTKIRGRKAGVKTVPDNETKADKFKRLGNKRLEKVRKAMKQIQNLSGAGYEYTPDQINIIGETLDKAVASVKSAFEGKKETEEKISL